MKLAGKVSPAYDEEQIHKMRTMIKKMRALGEWSGVQHSNFFRKYYKAAGRIRDVQLLLIKIRNGDCKVPPAFSEWLESRLHQMKINWQEIYNAGSSNKQFRKLKKSLKGKKQNEHALKFAADKNDLIISFRNERPLSDEQIHTGRKTIKEIDFLNKWENKKTDEGIKKVSDETGNFMDTCSAIKLLKLYIEQETDEAKRNDADILLTQWENDKEAEKIKLLTSIDSLPC